MSGFFGDDFNERIAKGVAQLLGRTQKPRPIVVRGIRELTVEPSPTSDQNKVIYLQDLHNDNTKGV